MSDQENEHKPCSICQEAEEYNHKDSLNHRFNFMLLEWNKYRKKIVQDSHDVAVTVKLVDIVNGTRLNYEEIKKRGSCITKATVAQATIQQQNGINYLFTIRNLHSTDTVILMKVSILHPDTSFQLLQVAGFEDLKVEKELFPNATYSFKVRYLPSQISVGSFKMPVMMKFQTRKYAAFSIAREMVVVVSDEGSPSYATETNKKSPFTSAAWEKEVKNWISPNEHSYRKLWENHCIPKNYYNTLKWGLREYNGMSDADYIVLQEIRDKLAPDYPTRHNYADFFHILLWLDEIGAVFMLKRYNMENVTMKRKPGDFLELDVPGLAEKRPSLIVGDYVNIRLHGDHTGYKGIIQAVKDKSIWISGANTELTEYVEDNPHAELDVSFQVGRLNHERMHAAVDRCFSNGMVQCLFPDTSLITHQIKGEYQISTTGFFNPDIVDNEEQKRAVINILNCTSGKAPYIVFGPPGTGKTITIVEAILQIKKLTTNRILICAPANAACDWITEKLILTGHCNKKELLRVHSASRDWSSVPEEVKQYSNYQDGAYVVPSDTDLLKYRIVISTLINIGRYGFKQIYHPDFVFIDEAAQALEPEANIPISLLAPGKQLVLAGDPKQLGPSCASAIAEKLQLGVSLLERLMKIPLYQNQDPNFITMLKLNFRAHPVVLEIPNQLFYENQLQAVSKYAVSDPIASIFVYCKLFNRRPEAPGQPVEFCSVIAKEKREGNSPSYFNTSEIEMVLKYVKTLLNLSETKVNQNHIGIVTPYIRQVYRIKESLKQSGYTEIEVGTAESFQGREKRIVIVSTVRAQHSLLLFDKKYKLGFVKNEKRFNVALTRAISKLIVIGCPNVLRYDKKCWLEFIDFCRSRYSYFGGEMDRRTEHTKLDIISRLKQFEPIKDKKGRKK